jgi:hypothetical protein
MVHPRSLIKGMSGAFRLASEVISNTFIYLALEPVHYIGGRIPLFSLYELADVTMHLLLRCFTATWVFVALHHGHTGAFAFSPTAITTFNEGFQYPKPTPLPHGFHDTHRGRQAGVSKPTCGWIGGNKGMSKSELGLVSCHLGYESSSAIADAPVSKTTPSLANLTISVEQHEHP